MSQLQWSIRGEEEELVAPAARPSKGPARSQARLPTRVVRARLEAHNEFDLARDALGDAEDLTHGTERGPILDDRHEVVRRIAPSAVSKVVSSTGLDPT
jgi:hypothetical protein